MIRFEDDEGVKLSAENRIKSFHSLPRFLGNSDLELRTSNEHGIYGWHCSNYIDRCPDPNDPKQAAQKVQAYKASRHSTPGTPRIVSAFETWDLAASMEEAYAEDPG